MRPFLREYRRPDEAVPPPLDGPEPPDAVALTWLGVAGYAITFGGTTLLLDPYVSRASLVDVAVRRLRPDGAAITRHVPPADAVCVGHSHYDHVADVAAIVRRDDCVVYGSRSVSNLLSAEGIKRRCFTTVPRGGAVFDVGPMTVTFVESRHGPIFFGRIPYPGPIGNDVRPPLRAFQYRVGDVFGIHVRAGGVSLYHNATANLHDEALAGRKADVVIMGLSGASYTKEYVARLAGALGATTVIPTHYDSFFAPLEAGLQVMPIIDLPAFFAAVRRLAPAVRVVMPGLGERLVVTQQGRVFSR